VLSLPILFAAGMSLMDTTDGVLMIRAYDWALAEPRRRLIYNLVTTGLSVSIAIIVGAVELAQVSVHLMQTRGTLTTWIEGLDFGVLGFAIVGLFSLCWIASTVAWKLRRL
jgi:high-affinity nickel-transport protein